MRARDLEEEISRIRSSYVEALPAKLASLEAALERWQSSVDPVVRDEAHRSAHSLAGSGATFGLPALSSTARELAEWLEARVHSGETPALSELATLGNLLGAVREAAGEPPQHSAAPERRPSAGDLTSAGDARKRAWLLGTPESGAPELARLFSAGGYAVERLRGVADLERIRPGRAPQIVLLDETLVADPALAEHASALEALRVPVAVFGNDGSVKARLAALRRGAAQLFTAPFGSAMVLAIDELLGGRYERPYRVLIVDDEIEHASFLSAQLRSAGMLVECLTDPLAVMTVFEEFRPEIVILDVNMPECTGIELARVLRQHDQLLAISIIFVSGAASWLVQREAMQSGGEDFLVKPIDPETVIAAVKAHAGRLRRLESRIDCDGLTGLCNQRTLRDRLRTEVARARRESVQLSVAVLDLDHFKSVNDTHGHPAGDRVLKTLAQLLRDTLRQTDTIGRIGGEEFAIILPRAAAPEAAGVLDEIRRTFQGVVHASGFGDFRVTLSCGVAALGSGMDGETLLDAADRALYRAKQLGRNRVELLPPPPRSGPPNREDGPGTPKFRRPSSTRMRKV